MGIFGNGGQADYVSSLSDEAIYGEPEEERQEDDTPQQEPDEDTVAPEDASPADEQTSEDGDSEDAPVEDEVAETGQAAITIEEYEKLQKSYNELRSWNSRVDTKNKMQENELAELRAKFQQPQVQPFQPQQFQTQPVDSEEAAKERARQLIQNPDAFITPLVEARLKPILAEREAEKAAIERTKRNEEFGNAFDECSKGWSQLESEEGRQAMVNKMVELSEMRGDKTAWQKDPAAYIQKSCWDLWGVPKVADPAAIEAARKAEREAVLREMEEKKNKAGRSITPPANRDVTSEKPLTEEEQIKAAMFATQHTGMFG